MQRLGLDNARGEAYKWGVTTAIKERTTPVTMKIAPKIHKRLKIASAETGIPMQELVTQALERFLENGKKAL